MPHDETEERADEPRFESLAEEREWEADRDEAEASDFWAWAVNH